MRMVEINIIDPQNASSPIHPLFKIAPAMGLPTSTAAATGKKSMPILTPITEGDGDMVNTMVGFSEMKDPLKELQSITG